MSQDRRGGWELQRASLTRDFIPQLQQHSPLQLTVFHSSQDKVSKTADNMLSNIGRAAIRRAGPGANASSTKRVLQSGWHLQRFDASKNTESSAVQNQLVFLKRQYATATKATQTTKPRTKTAAKPGAKPKSKLNKAPKAPTKKKALKKKVVKKVAKKKVAKKVIKKKVLTPEQQTRQKIKQLKKVALSPPTRKAQSAWMVFLEEARASPAGETPQAVMKSASARYKSLPAEELQVRSR